jgi:hypothetical protein
MAARLACRLPCLNTEFVRIVLPEITRLIGHLAIFGMAIGNGITRLGRWVQGPQYICKLCICKPDIVGVGLVKESLVHHTKVL